MDEQAVIDATRRWISTIVIGLNLCPFARRVFEAGAIRYVVSGADKEEQLLDDLATEIKALVATPIAQVETTLLIHPRIFGDFFQFNDFVGRANFVIDDLRLRGAIQIADFHPRYRFAGMDADAAENFTNRSPYPMLHLLREESISAVAHPDDPVEIPRRNIATLRGLGRERILEMLKAIVSDAGDVRSYAPPPGR